MTFYFDYVWQIMKKYDFNKENEIENEYLCTLCGKILINAHISPCECRFCFDCISNYLNKERKSCPGNTNKCKMILIFLNKNILVDNSINNKISKLIVKCPEKSCEFKDELRNIGNHIRICNYRRISCPYLNIGCNPSNMHVGNVIDHLQLEIENHTKLLIDCIDNLNNEIGRLKTSVDKLGEENKMLRCEINEMKLDAEKKQMKCEEQDREIDLLNEDMVALRNVDKYMREDVDKLKLDEARKKMEINKLNMKLQEMESKFEIEIKSNNEKEFAQLKSDEDRNKKSIEELEKKFEQHNGQVEQQFNNKYQQIENKFVNATQERENKEKDLMRNIDQMKNKQTEMTTMSNKINRTMKDVENKLLEMEINQYKMRNKEFVWRIKKIHDKMKDAKSGINTKIYSDSFYTHKNGYKMCLSLYPDGDDDVKTTHLSVFFHLMKGEFDDILQWPFKYDVTLSLINQQTGLAHISGTTKYDDFPDDKDWNKPINERNVGFGETEFIKLKSLSTNANLIRNNQIFIKCSVNIPS